MTHRRLLSRVCLAGAALTLLLCGFTVYVFVCSGKSLFLPRGGEPALGESFHQKLLKYDAFAATFPPFEDLARDLDALEKDALGTESHLSVLKRRRVLARDGIAAGNTYDWTAYLAAAERAAAKFPADEAILAVVSEAAVRSGYREKAWEYAAGIAEKSLLPLAFGAAVLAGALETPEKAAALERSGELFLSLRENDPVRNREGFIVNAAIVRVLTGDVRGAGVLIPALIGAKSGPESAAGKALNFAAEYYYDFGDPGRAAELFVRLGGEADLGRAADALALAGEREYAKSLWIVLSSPDENGFIVTPPEILVRSLYNLAAVAETPEEELALVRRALSIDPEHLCSLVRYSRFLPTEQALAFLDNDGANRDKPLIGLELLKRRRENWPVEKIIPETWFLLNRHDASAAVPGGEPGASILYQWACYYFDFQKQYDESARLIRDAERNGMGGPWLDFHRALALFRKNDFAEGEALLLGIEERYGQGGNRTGPGNPDNADGIFWQVPANLGRIREAGHSFQTALAYYEIAAARAGGKTAAARVYYRIARCLRSLGRDRKARDALERGLSLDGENMAIRLELTRFDELGIF